MEIIVKLKISDANSCNTCFSRQEFKNALGDRIDVCRVFNRVLKSETSKTALVTHYERCAECIAAECPGTNGIEIVSADEMEEYEIL